MSDGHPVVRGGQHVLRGEQRGAVHEPLADGAVVAVPFICHRPTTPSSLRHRMSLLPSPPKSPVPAICQVLSICRMLVAEAIAVPFICHSPTSPESLRHRMSLLPSPPKSPVPSTCQ